MDKTVSLVIPGRNAARTIRPCLESVMPLLDHHGLKEIIVVDDGSTDETAQIVQEFPVRYIRGEGKGPGSARNIGWRAATSALVWFIDSDCVAEPDALPMLLGHLKDPQVAGVGGSYGNMRPDSLLACLIHEEIVARHGAMGLKVDFLGSFNVLYKRQMLEAVGGFDEGSVNGPGSPGAEDAELAYRLHEAGYVLHFTSHSRVQHYHPTSLRRYLQSQLHHGYWRVNLHFQHPTKGTGDSYSNLVDNAQPPLAVFLMGALPFLAVPSACLAVSMSGGALALLQVPMTIKLIRRTSQWRYLTFIPMSLVRAFARGIGMTLGFCAALQTLRNRRA